MADLRPVAPGQPLRFSAGDINACFEAARAHRARQLNAVAEASAFGQAGVVLVQNDSGTDRDILEVLAIDVPLILPSDNLERWRERVTFSGVTPGTTHSGRYVVLQEPIANGKIGRAMVIGVTPALLDVTAESDRFAEVVDTVATSLKTGTTGSARILWKESGTGSKRGVVMLTGETDAEKNIVYVSQASHGFSVGNVIRHNGSSFVKSQADTPEKSHHCGIVISVHGTDAFRYALPGSYVTGLSGLTAGLNFVSSATAGLLTTTAPTNMHAAFLATSTTAGIVLPDSPCLTVSTSDPGSTAAADGDLWFKY